MVLGSPRERGGGGGWLFLGRFGEGCPAESPGPISHQNYVIFRYNLSPGLSKRRSHFQTKIIKIDTLFEYFRPERAEKKKIYQFPVYFRWVTVNDTLASEDPCFFCAICFKGLHYTPNGEKICDFQAYPVVGDFDW